MTKHKSEDYKLSAVKYYLNNHVSLNDVCLIFDCPKQSLYRWIKRYEELEEIERLNRKPKSYKITKEQVKYAIQKLKENEQITMEELCKIVKKKYKDFDITPQHFGRCEKFQIRENPKPYKSGNILVHGLNKCKTCSGVWNRDVNGATNICRIAKNAINGIERPKYLCREKKEEYINVEKPKKEKVKKVVQKKANKSVKVVALTKS